MLTYDRRWLIDRRISAQLPNLPKNMTVGRERELLLLNKHGPPLQTAPQSCNR